MSYNSELTERVRQALAGIPEVKEIKMFGSIGFKVNDKLCLGVGNHEDHIMMVRVGLAAYAEALAKPGAEAAIMRGRERRGYVFLAPEAVETNEGLLYWVTLALEFNKMLTGSTNKSGNGNY